MKVLLKFLLAVFCLHGLNGYGQKKQMQSHAAKVIVFLDTECPISRSYMTELQKLSQDYESRSVKFEAIFPVYTVNEKEIKTFLKKYNITFPGFTDKDHSKTKRFHATTMPEALLINTQGIVVYKGAIDNWYVALGKNRPKPTEFYLRNAIEATLNGNPVLTPRTQAVGCLINH